MTDATTPEGEADARDEDGGQEADEMTMQTDGKHFDLVRLAQTRGVQPKRLSSLLYAVPSHSTPGEFYRVTSDGLCHCKAAQAKKRCTHSELVKREVARDADGFGYRNAERDDWLLLRLRMVAGTLTKSDKTYLRYCLKLASRKHPSLIPAKASGLRRVEAGGKVRTYVGAFQI